MKKVTYTKGGDTIKVKTKDKDGNIIKHKYRVTEVYPHCVIGETIMGVRRGFSYGDLVRLGKEMQ